MKINYKFWYITRQDDIHISECAIRFFEGDVITADETDMKNPTGAKISVTRYRMTKRLQANDLVHLGKPIKKELSGDDCVIYTSKDFGVISDNDELRVFLNGELAKDPIRDVNDVQNETDLVELKKREIR